MSHPRLSRRGVLIGGVAALAAVGGGSSWALDRFVIDHPQVSNVSDLEAQASSTATSAPSVAAGEPTIAVTTWTQGSGTDKVTGYVADVTTPDASFLRTAFAEDTFGTNIVADPSVIAAQVGATLAINGDYYGFRDEGIVIRNGIAYRDAGARTGLALHGDGTLALYDETSTSAQALVDRATKNPRRGRAAAVSLIPTSTGAAIATIQSAYLMGDGPGPGPLIRSEVSP